MKLFRTILNTVLILVVSIALVSCFKSESGPSKTYGKADYVKIVYAYVSFNNIPEDVSEIEEKINEITRDKIGVEVQLMPLSIINYTQQINLAMQGGEQLDVFHSLGDFSQSVSKHRAYDLTDILDENASGAVEQVGSTLMQATTINDHVYGIPADKGVAVVPTFMYRADIMRELGIDSSTIKDVHDLTKVFEKVKAKYPDMIPLGTINIGDTGITQTLNFMDCLTDDLFSPKGVLAKDNKTVVDFYQTDEFMDKVTLVREWYNKGYISKDAATTTSLAIELISAGTAFSLIGGYAGTDAPSQISAQTGQSIEGIRIGEPYISTTNANQITWMVASTSKHPEAALKFLDLTYTDPEVVNLIVYGIEGRDYIKVGERTVIWPEGLDSQTVPYTAQLSCGIIGSQFNQYILKGADLSSLDIMKEENKTAHVSEAFGFIFDPSPVKNEYTAVINVINQYYPGFRCGVLDISTELPKFIDKLNESGMNKIISEKQRQLDTWYESR